MDNNKKNIANTMEINAILEEAKKLRAGNTQTADTTLNTKQTDSDTQQVDISNPADIQDDFVMYNEKKNKNQKAKKEKKSLDKKKLAMGLLIAGIVVVVLVAGFCVYTIFGEFKFPTNVYVNNVAIGGMTEREAQDLLAAEEEKLAAQINIVVKADDKSTTLKKDDLTYTFTTQQILEQAKEYSKDTLVPSGEQNYTIAISLDDESLAEVADKVAKALEQEAVDAVVTKFDSSKKGDAKFTIDDSKKGIKLKKEEFITQLKDFVADGTVSGDIEAQADITEPKYSKEFLLKNIKKLSSFTTVSTNNSNGNANMKLSLSQCNNSIINPDEVWSFNDCTGNSNLTSNGYKPAGVIVNGKHTTGVGGGICQSSTTIYNATLLCGMEVVERSCHYYKSTYVDAGRDATVDYGNLDLKVKNPFDYQLFMECYMDGTTLYCNMYGLENPEFDEIKISSSITSYFSNGFRAQTTRTYYLDGKKVDSESLPNSTYYTSEPDSGSSSKKSSKKSSKTSSKTSSETSSKTSSTTTSVAPTEAVSDTPQSSVPATEAPPVSSEPASSTPSASDSNPGTSSDLSILIE